MVPKGIKVNSINMYNARSVWYESQDKIKAQVKASIEAEKREDSLDETLTTEMARDANLLVQS